MNVLRLKCVCMSVCLRFWIMCDNIFDLLQREKGIKTQPSLALLLLNNQEKRNVYKYFVGF